MLRACTWHGIYRYFLANAARHATLAPMNHYKWSSHVPEFHFCTAFMKTQVDICGALTSSKWASACGFKYAHWRIHYAVHPLRKRAAERKVKKVKYETFIGYAVITLINAILFPTHTYSILDCCLKSKKRFNSQKFNSWNALPLTDLVPHAQQQDLSALDEGRVGLPDVNHDRSIPHL